MESLDNTNWDVVISGTGIPQSLLALALSRSGKTVLHLDENDYYGGDEAALSVTEAEIWAKKHAGLPAEIGPGYSHAFIDQASTNEEEGNTKLAQARAYSLALAPHLLYARSSLLSALVSAKTDTQLEFQATGSWFLVDTPPEGSASQARLTRVPGGREDVFQDETLDLRAKRSLMKFLRFVVNFDEHAEVLEEYQDKPFSALLSEKFGLSSTSHAAILALASSTSNADDTTAGFAIPRVARHLTSIGLFGPGFGAVLPKYGGLAEIGQVACRACAVGGGVYVLGKGIASAKEVNDSALSLELTGGEQVTAKWIAGIPRDLPSTLSPRESKERGSPKTKSISIVSSPLTSLFPPTSEGGVIPAGAVVIVNANGNEPPVHIFVHSSESGECPKGQCIMYASVGLDHVRGVSVLKSAIRHVLDSIGEQPAPRVLWSMCYEQHDALSSRTSPTLRSVVELQPLSSDMIFDDATLSDTKTAWQRITDGEPDLFMQFEARDGAAGDEDMI